MKKLLPIIFLSLITSLSFAKEQIEIKNETQLSKIDKVKIILDEKQRLKKIENRRAKTDEKALNYFYIDKTKYTELQKSLMRESVFYLNYVADNYNNRKALEKEVTNIGMNAICLSIDLKEGTDIVFNLLLSTTFPAPSTGENIRLQHFEEGNKIINELFMKEKPMSKEEIQLRCVDIYK